MTDYRLPRKQGIPAGGAGVPSRPNGRRILHLAAFATPCCVIALLAAGCGSAAPSGPSEPLMQLNSTAAFDTTVLDARQPVMVLFYKEGCPACANVESTLGQLAAEYHGRALFTKYPLANFLAISENRELRDKYEVAIWPTVILFLDGREKFRWTTSSFPADAYRKRLDDLLSIRKSQ